MRFRPCIDLHDGKVKQVVENAVSESGNGLVTNFVAREDPAYFARLYRRDGLAGGHVVMLGPGNEEAARSALKAYPDGLQVGGGITESNASGWLRCGARKVIVTSAVFHNGHVDWRTLRALEKTAGREHLVLDVSCRRQPDGTHRIVTDRWQVVTEVTVTRSTLADLAEFCSEFLVHAVDVEGKQAGIAEDLIGRLAADSPVGVTYAGGVRNLEDLHRIEELGNGRVDATAGSALDIFGGTGLRYADVVAFDKARRG